MTKRSTTWRKMSWRRGATRGLLALAVLSLSTSTQVQLGTWTPSPGVALAEELDCIDDKDNFNLPECVQQREAAEHEAEQARKAKEAQDASDEQAAEQQANQPPPSAPSNPNDIIFTIKDAGKEATQYLSELDKTDKYGRWARTRYERERTTAASTMGPAVIDTRAWVAKDIDAAKALFKEEASIKDFPERKEPLTGPNEKIKPIKAGEEYAVATQYFQDEDGKIWLHFRFVIRNGKNVGVLYLFGRQDFFADKEDRKWNGQGDWYITEFANRI